MQCVILAAGRGTRMQELTRDTPKPLLNYPRLGGLPRRGIEKPILEQTLESLPREIDEVIFVIGYLDKKIRAFVRDFNPTLPPLNIRGGLGGVKFTFVEQKRLNGTGGALTLCRQNLIGRFLVLNGDDLYSAADLSRLIAHKLAVLGFWSRDWNGSSLIIDENGYLRGIENNPPPQEEKIANAGAYILDERFFNYPLATIKNGKEFSLPHTLIKMAEDNNIFVERASFWKHINTPHDLEY